MTMRNLVNYHKQRRQNLREVWFTGDVALKRGRGMCYDLDYLTTETGETATDGFCTRGNYIQVPSTSNNQAFAGALTQSYSAKVGGQFVTIAEPGSVVLLAQRVASVINTKLITCAVGTGIAGLFGHGGFRGRGSAIPLQTLAAATGGDLAFQNILGTATSVYDSGTGLTTFTMTAAGTALGYLTAAVDASAYEVTVWGGATASDSTTEQCPSGVYPVVQAVTADTFTVTGDTGDGACTINLTKQGLLTLAYLCDGEESGLCDYFLPETADVDPPDMDTGMSICLGGLTLAADCEPVVPDGTMDGQRKGFYMLATLVTKEILWNITDAMDQEEGVLSTLEMNTAGEFAIMTWHQFGPTAGNGHWQLDAISGTSVAAA